MRPGVTTPKKVEVEIEAASAVALVTLPNTDPAATCAKLENGKSPVTSEVRSTDVPRVVVIVGEEPMTVNEVHEAPEEHEAVPVATPKTPAPPLETRRLLDAGWLVVASPTHVNAPVPLL
jgi:hypothetical protein